MIFFYNSIRKIIKKITKKLKKEFLKKYMFYTNSSINPISTSSAIIVNLSDVSTAPPF
jgi:hypothetical protein